MTDTPDTEAVKRLAFAMCREENPCTSMTHEIMDMPDYRKGREGDAGAMTLAGRYRSLARAALAAMPPQVTVKPLEWEDYPAVNGPVRSQAVALNGTYFIVDDTDDFSGLYLQFISHDNAKWWQHVRSTCEAIMENVHDDDLAPIKAAAQADYERRILSALTTEGSKP